MNLNLDTAKRSRLYLAMLRALEADPTDSSVGSVKANAVAELVAFFPDRLVAATAIATAIEPQVNARNGIASIEAEELEEVLEQDAVTARLAAALLGLVRVHDDSISTDYFHTAGVPVGRISVDTVIPLMSVGGDA